MNVTILAANGQIAHLVEDRILNEAAFKDVNLTLMLRRASRLANPTDVIKATKDADLVWSAVVDHDDTNRPTKSILAAAKENGFTRVVETSLLGLYNEVPGELGRWNREYCFGGDPTGTTPVLADQMLEESGLDYTTLRLPWLNDRPEVKYVLTHRHGELIGVSASRQSIADVVCRIIADPTLGSHDSLGISDPDTQGEDRQGAGKNLLHSKVQHAKTAQSKELWSFIEQVANTAVNSLVIKNITGDAKSPLTSTTNLEEKADKLGQEEPISAPDGKAKVQDNVNDTQPVEEK